MKKTFLNIALVFLFLIIIHSASAQITIDSFTSNPDTVQPGEEVDIKIHLENVGRDDIKNIVVSIDLSDLPFAPIRSSSEKIIEKIKDGEEETVSFDLEALSNVKPGTYKIPVTISYENTTKVSLISIKVNTDASIQAILESSDLVLVNKEGKVTIKFVNDGLTQVKFLKVTLLEDDGYNSLSPNSLYIGEIDSGDFETEEFTILPNKNNPKLFLELEYRDENNKNFTETQDIELTVYTEEQAKELGLVKEGHMFSWILVAIVTGMVISLVFKRKRQKRNVY